MSAEFIQGEVKALTKRGITEETCRKFGYTLGTNRSGQKVQVANYRNSAGELVAQKVRDAEKNFSVIGEGKDMPLFGQHMWPATGKRLVVTEGELDALSVAQVFPGWPVVSLPNGAQSAKKAIQRAIEFVEGYDAVVFAFDMDEPGRAAAVECAALLTPGKALIAEMSEKDANAMLLAGKVKELTGAVWNARVYRPDGIVSGSDIWTALAARNEPGIPYFLPQLTEMTCGQRPGTLVTWIAGTGIGKSTTVAKVLYDYAYPTSGEPGQVGVIAIEEGVARTAHRFLSQRLGRLTHIPGKVSDTDMRRAFDETLGKGNVHILDGFGSMDIDGVVSKIRFLAKGLGCKAVMMDHVSGLASGLSATEDERRAIDQFVTRVRSLAEETGVTVHMISHLRRLHSDESHEQGAQIGMNHIRGSHGIAQWSDDIIALERDSQAEGDGRCLTRVRVLKARMTGFCGLAGYFTYDPVTGVISEAAPPGEDVFEEESNVRDF